MEVERESCRVESSVLSSLYQFVLKQVYLKLYCSPESDSIYLKLYCTHHSIPYLKLYCTHRSTYTIFEIVLYSPLYTELVLYCPAQWNQGTWTPDKIN